MSPDTPQSFKRSTKTGSRSGNDTPGAEFDTTAQPQTDPLNASSGSGGAATPSSGILNQVRDKAASQLNEQKARATEQLGGVAQAVRQSTRQLREQQYDTVAQFVERAADQIERFSNHLRDRDLNELVGEAQRFARQQPAVFIGSSFAAGLLAARFIKASRPTESFATRGTAYGGSDTGYDRGGAFDRGPSYGAGAGSYGTGTSYGSGASYGAGTPQTGGFGTSEYGGGTSTDRGTSFNTSTRPGDETGRGDL